jgi:hypothetical protein
VIYPEEDDIGRAVVYKGQKAMRLALLYPQPEKGGRGNRGKAEGVITSFNDHSVFVRYGADKHSKGTSRADLEWVREN